MPNQTRQVTTYSTLAGLVYIFNLIVGTGALTLPAGFYSGGWVLGTILLVIFAFASYINSTFVIESIACANATHTWRYIQSHKIDEECEAYLDSDEAEEVDVNEETAIIYRPTGRFYSMTKQFELGQIAKLYYNRTGQVLFYIVLCVYLYGDLSIYVAAIGQTLTDITCGINSTNITFADVCSESIPMAKEKVYHVWLIVFIGLIGPFSFFHVKKMLYLQIFTVILRGTAFFLMIVYSIFELTLYGRRGFPLQASLIGTPALLGATVYSFMCHHSLPGLVGPLAKKELVNKHIALDTVIIAIFYLLLSLTGIFAFSVVQDLYTLNFIPNPNDSFAYKVMGYFIGLFPVFTLSSSFPILAITLQSNLKALFLDVERIETYNFVLRRLLFPTVAILPPIVLAFVTHDLKMLVGFTGAYAGAGIQYVIPATLVYCARQRCKADLGSAIANKFSSPFKGNKWIYFVIAWCFLCVLCVTINIIRSF
ncbi:transmembrane protein 104 homolog [Agrilus planipennis]|uniref:Transmembrane protein 104 homolog n=1 Tax=Agrilus planipennis TaxID=224129 RepID=A0A1W4WYM3_AGRPL|nr:transmembrane protein 104 homolog [Agrilus planipennis]